MTEPAAPPTTALPPASANGSAPDSLPGSAPGSAPPTPAVPQSPVPKSPGRVRLRSRIGAVWTALIVGAVVLILVLIFIIQNAHTVTINFLGAHLHLSLAVALLLAAIAGALIMAAAGTLRITQLRRMVRRGRREPRTGQLS